MFHPDGPSFWELARQALSGTAAGYDLLAPKFDVTPFRTPDAVIDAALAVLPEEVLRGDALDVCCGTGAAGARLAAHGARSVTGIDFSPGMLAEARRRSEATGSAVRYLLGDVLALEADSAYDLVVCFGALGHIRRRDEAAFLSRIHRCLRPGGCFVFVTAVVPPVYAPGRILAHAFNGVMRLRNLLPGRPFIMYYLTFMLPDVTALLVGAGFSPEVKSGEFPSPFEKLKVVIAHKF